MDLRNRTGSLAGRWFSWTARVLAVAAVALLGKSNDAVASDDSEDFGSKAAYRAYKAKNWIAHSRVVSYIQIGDFGEDGGGPPPTVE
jgi:hypothetical protein